ncbi:MAG TPA: PAS domain S-box protein [Nitrospira sp.]|nr:PAS domain S-box protein [Nitrospira sp.]
MSSQTPAYSILVVEDNPDIVIGLQDLLQHDGYAVSIAGTCAEALAQIRARRFNAVLLDLQLPDGDGTDVLKEMQQLDATVPVVILTAHISQERTVGSLIKGAFGYLTKPYNREELRQTLRRAVGVKELAVKAERAEHLLIESEDRFRSLVESATDAIVLADGQGTILSWNRAASVLFGYASEEAVGQPLTILMPIRYRQRHQEGIARMESTGKSRVIGSVIELHGLRKDGMEFPIELSLATWKTSAGSFYSGIIRDISQRKQTEQALKQLEHQHTLILDQAGEGIYGLDLSGRTTFVNPSAAWMLGYQVSELIGQPMHEILHHTRADGSPYPREACPIYSVMHDGLVHRVEDDIFWKKNGTSFPVEYVSTPIQEGREIVGAVVVFRDMTERRQAQRAVEDSQRRFRQLAEHINEVFWITDPVKSQIVYISPAYERVWMRSCESLYASPHSWLDAVHPEDRERVRDAAFTKETLGTYDEEYRIVRPDGSVRWIWDRAYPVHDRDGRVYRIVGLAEDITTKKEVEAALRASEERLELVIHGSNDGFWDGRALPDRPWYSPETPVWYSPRVKTMLGYSDAEFPDVLESWTSRLHPGDRERVFEALRAHIEQRIPYDVEYRLKTKQNDYHWVRARGQAVWDAGGRVVRMSGSLQSTMDRRRAEEAARRGEHLLRTLADNTTAVIYIKDVEGRFLLVNRRFQELFRLPAEQIIGRTNHDIFPAAIADAFRANDLEVLTKKRTIEYEESAPLQDGLHTYLSIKFPLCDESGEVYATCGISTDITERKRMEEALRTHDAQLRLALKAADVGIWNWDLLTGRLFWSSQVSRFFAMDRAGESLTVKDWLARVHPDERDEFGAALIRVKEQRGDDVLLGHHVLCRDGTVRGVVWTGQIMRDRSKQAIHILGTFGTSDERNDHEPNIYSPWTGM